MKFNPEKLTVFSLAVITTAISTMIAVLGAYGRTADNTHRVILAAVSVVAAVAVHLLPATSGRTHKPLRLLTWTLCFIFVVYSHCATFVSLSEQSAEIRFSTSRLSRSTQERKDEIRRSLSKIQSRSVTTIARLIARAKSEEQVTALQLEMSEAQRAVRLQEQLDLLTATVGTAVVTDPVSARVTAITGWSPDSVTLTFSVLGAVMLELLGAILWIKTIGEGTSESGDQHPDSRLKSNDDSRRGSHDSAAELAILRDALARGTCTTRVTDIRAFLRCGQEKAMLLRRELIQSQIRVARPDNPESTRFYESPVHSRAAQ
jgi:hypothetical protein